jgi:hypothetical protein
MMSRESNFQGAKHPIGLLAKELSDRFNGLKSLKVVGEGVERDRCITIERYLQL